jgi:hypothetical protein
MMMSKASKLWIVVFAIYNILAVSMGFVLWSKDLIGISFWIAYAFMDVSLLIALHTYKMLAKSQFAVKDWFFGYPIIKHCFIYVLTTFILSLLFMALSLYVTWVIPVLIFVLGLAVYLFFEISCMISKEVIANTQVRVKEKTDYIRLLQVDAEMLAENCNEPEAKAQFKQFAEAVRYSDPMSNETLFELEKEILLKINDASQLLKEDKVDDACAVCKQAQLLLLERNKKCKALK